MLNGRRNVLPLEIQPRRRRRQASAPRRQPGKTPLSLAHLMAHFGIRLDDRDALFVFGCDLEFKSVVGQLNGARHIFWDAPAAFETWASAPRAYS